MSNFLIKFENFIIRIINNLWYHGQSLSELVKSDIVDFDFIDPYLTFMILDDPKQSQSERRLARACSTHNANLLATIDLDIEIDQNRTQVRSISHRIVNESDATMLRPI